MKGWPEILTPIRQTGRHAQNTPNTGASAYTAYMENTEMSYFCGFFLLYIKVRSSIAHWVKSLYPPVTLNAHRRFFPRKSALDFLK